MGTWGEGRPPRAAMSLHYYGKSRPRVRQTYGPRRSHARRTGRYSPPIIVIIPGDPSRGHPADTGPPQILDRPVVCYNQTVELRPLNGRPCSARSPAKPRRVVISLTL
jgi:hypothetical protein